MGFNFRAFHARYDKNGYLPRGVGHQTIQQCNLPWRLRAKYDAFSRELEIKGISLTFGRARRSRLAMWVAACDLAPIKIPRLGFIMHEETVS